MTAIVTQGDAANLLLPDACVDTVICSPPYFGLRSYQDGGVHYQGQVGDEATPTEYLDALIACTAEWMRVLKPGGSIFVNLGDKYQSTAPGTTNSPHRKYGSAAKEAAQFRPDMGVRSKSLVGFPWRYAIRCIDELSLILRAEIVWAKPNGLPESVTDRVRRSHEQVFHFVKQPRYYSGVDEIREESTPQKGAAGTFRRERPSHALVPGQSVTQHRQDRPDVPAANPLGKLPGSVWTIPTAPLKVPASLGIDHFAAYPPELVRRIVLGWSPREVCTACGEGRRPVSEKSAPYNPHQNRFTQTARPEPHGASRENTTLGWQRDTTIIGYACACPDTTAPSTPGVVLDPFGGTGTSALVASAFGRVGISVDLSADYCRLARWRTTDPGERARVLGVEKPPVQVDGQLGMFEGIGA